MTVKYDFYLDSIMRGKYTSMKAAKQDILHLLKVFRHLKPTMDKYYNSNGSVKELICVSGTIPVNYKGTTYNIPIAIWLQESHPQLPPLCFVKPTSNMQVKQGKHVDANGRVYLPYLNEWKPQTHTLEGLVEILQVIFSQESPLCTKPVTPTLLNIGSQPGYSHSVPNSPIHDSSTKSSTEQLIDLWASFPLEPYTKWATTDDTTISEQQDTPGVTSNSIIQQACSNMLLLKQNETEKSKIPSEFKVGQESIDKIMQKFQNEITDVGTDIFNMGPDTDGCFVDEESTEEEILGENKNNKKKANYSEDTLLELNTKLQTLKEKQKDMKIQLLELTVEIEKLQCEIATVKLKML
ncbi:uncharacterized protein LOC144745992 [Ciona intestinalis]